MSAARIKLITILCLFSRALSGPENGGVVWRDPGTSITIQCTDTATDQERLTLEKGLNKDEILYIYKTKSSEKQTIANGFKDRLQLHGTFPNISILIKNLTTDDMGPYWCIYKKYVPSSSQMQTNKGKGSVLLVVRDQKHMGRTPDSENPKQCDSSDKNLILLSVVITAAILLGIIVGFLVWIVLKTKALRSARSTVKPRRAATNDVYEDMRGNRRH